MPLLGARLRSSVCDVRGCSATSPPDLTTPSGPDFTKRAIPTARSIEAALAWRYPTNIPAARASTSPATPGEASAASTTRDSGARNGINGVLENRPHLLRNQTVRQHRLESNRVLFGRAAGAKPRGGRCVTPRRRQSCPNRSVRRSISGQPACRAARGCQLSADSAVQAHLRKGFRRSRPYSPRRSSPSPIAG